MITNSQSCTNVQEIADGIYRINTPISVPDGPGKFSFNQYLVMDDEPLLFHTGPRRLFPFIEEAIRSVVPLHKLRYVGLSHYEADECGSLNAFLAASPRAIPFCSRIAAMTSVEDFAERPPRSFTDCEELSLGHHTIRWFDTPHMPHAWECGLMMELTTRTFFCGDLFTQGGPGEVALTEADILGPSEAFRNSMDYFAHSPQTQAMLERRSSGQLFWLACMAAHGAGTVPPS